MMTFDWRTARHFAVGYAEGRYVGNDEFLYPDGLKDDERHARKIGYDAGVADFCAEELDNEDAE